MQVVSSSSGGTAYFIGVSCGVCSKHVAWMVNHKEEDRTEIFSLLEKKGTQIMCLSCYDKHAAKNVYSEDTYNEMK